MFPCSRNISCVDTSMCRLCALEHVCERVHVCVCVAAGRSSSQTTGEIAGETEKYSAANPGRQTKGTSHCADSRHAS